MRHPAALTAVLICTVAGGAGCSGAMKRYRATVHRIAVLPATLDMDEAAMRLIGPGNQERIERSYEDELCLTLSRQGYEIVPPAVFRPARRRILDRMGSARDLQGNPLERTDGQAVAVQKELIGDARVDHGAQAVAILQIYGQKVAIRSGRAEWAGKVEKAERLTVGNVLATVLARDLKPNEVRAATLYVNVRFADPEMDPIWGGDAGICLMQHVEMAQAEDLDPASRLMDPERVTWAVQHALGPLAADGGQEWRTRPVDRVAR